jgi:hypothetical protein
LRDSEFNVSGQYGSVLAIKIYGLALFRSPI